MIDEDLRNQIKKELSRELEQRRGDMIIAVAWAAMIAGVGACVGWFACLAFLTD